MSPRAHDDAWGRNFQVTGSDYRKLVPETDGIHAANGKSVKPCPNCGKDRAMYCKAWVMPRCPKCGHERKDLVA